MGGGGTEIHTPQPTPAPSTSEAIDAWVKSMPTVFAEQQRQAPLQAQQQVNLARQYAGPMGSAMRDAQQAMYPEMSALHESLAGQALEGMEAGVPDWAREQYRSDMAANLGTNVGSGMGADYISKGLLQQRQDTQNYYRNLGLTLSGQQPLSQPTMPTTGQYSQQFTPQNVMGFMGQGYGSQMQAQRPITQAMPTSLWGFFGSTR